MNSVRIAQELVCVAKLVALDSAGMEDLIDELAKYTAAIAKALLKLRRPYGIRSIRQNYKGTGRQRARRQLWVKLSNDEAVDVWLDAESYSIGGVTMLRMKGSFPYFGKSPALVAREIADKLKILSV